MNAGALFLLGVRATCKVNGVNGCSQLDELALHPLQRSQQPPLLFLLCLKLSRQCAMTLSQCCHGWARCK